MKIRLVALLAAVLAPTGAGVATAGDAGPGEPAMKSGVAPAAGTTQGLGSYARVTGYTYTVAPGGFSYSTAYCPAGMRVLGGGGSNNSMGGIVMTDSYPAYDTYWNVYVKNAGTVPATFTPWAICGS